MQQNEDNVLNAIPVKGVSFPNWADLFALLAIFFIGALAASYLVPLFMSPEVLSDMDGDMLAAEGRALVLFLCYMVQMSLVLVLSIGYSKLRGYRGEFVRLSVQGLNPLLNLWALIMFLAINLLLSPLFEFMEFSQIESYDPGRGIWALLSTVVMAPILEEILCRGVVLEPLRNRYGAVVAWLFSSLFFAVIHIHPAMVINALFSGLLFAYLYMRTNSLWPCIILHMFNNGVSLLMLWTLIPAEQGQMVPLSELSLHEMISPVFYVALYISALIFVLISGVLMWYNLWQWHSSDRKKRLEGK